MIIKFITINIWHGGKIFDNLVFFLQKEKPDILSMQEVYDGKDPLLERRFRTVEVLKKELGFPYSSFGQRLFDTTHDNLAHGNAVLSRYFLQEEGPFQFFDIPLSPIAVEGSKTAFDWPFGMQKVAIDIEGKKLHLVNVHGLWGFDSLDNERRLKMAERIVSEINGKERIIVAGDFNMASNTQTIGKIEKHLTSVFGNKLASTFNLKYKKGGGFGSASVDMVFVSNDIEVKNHYMPSVDVSDHMPLVVEFSL